MSPTSKTPPQEDPYGERYYDGYQTLRTDGDDGAPPVPYRWGESFWESYFDQVAAQIVAGLHPHTALDAGCAVGFLVKALRDHGVEAEGVDGSAWAVSQAPEELRPYCRVGSITAELGKDYDLITCIEVLEHVTSGEAALAVANFCRHARAVLISSTPDHFDEITHINMHPPEHWVSLFARNGFYRDFDFDAGFVAPHAILFHRAAHVEQVVRGYERWIAESQRELAGIRAHRDRLHAEMGTLLGARAELQAVLNTKTFRYSAGLRSLWARRPGRAAPGKPPRAPT